MFERLLVRIKQRHFTFDSTKERINTENEQLYLDGRREFVGISELCSYDLYREYVGKRSVQFTSTTHEKLTLTKFQLCLSSST